MGLMLVTPPASMPVTIEEARAQVGVHTSDAAYDTKLTGYIAAATSRLDGRDGELGRAIMPQTWDYTLDAFTSSIELPLGPVTEVQSVKYFDEDGTERTVDPDTYTVDLASSRQWVLLNSGYSWPATLSGVNAVTIRFTAGRGAAPAIKLAILLAVDHYFQPIGPNNTVADFERAWDALTGTKRLMSL